MTIDQLGIASWQGMIRFYEAGVRRRPAFRYWQALEASQWSTPSELGALQFERLRRLLLHAQATSPWYRDTWRAGGLDVQALHTTSDFQRWPIIDREAVRSHRLAMRCPTAGSRLIHKATGGSSGVPLQFDLDRDSNDRRMGAWHRGYAWGGAEPGTRQWYLWGVAAASTASWRKRKARWYDALYRRTTASCFELGTATVDRFLASLVRTRPHAIVAYTNAIYEFARMLEARGLVPPSPRSIMVGAERLHDYQRQTIERVFRAPVFETYGSREFMLIGAECDRHAGLHLTHENLLVELVDDEGLPVQPGTEGNVVITDLTNFGMPFIRYANGDRAIAAQSTCSCGRGLPLLQKVTGRRLDVLTTPDGRSLPGEFFPHILKDLPAIDRYQVVQERPDTIVIRIVAPSWTPTDEAWLRREVTAVAGTTIHLDVEQVSHIPLTAAGKLQVVVNRLASSDRERA